MIFLLGKPFMIILAAGVSMGYGNIFLDRLNRTARNKIGRTANPSYGIIDAQSVKTQYTSEERGIDGDKKVKENKLHIIVDELGNLLHVQVHAANVSNIKAACYRVQSK